MSTASGAAEQPIDSPYAWRMVGVAFIAGFVVFGVIYSFGVFLGPLMTDLDASRSATSGIYAIASSMFYFSGPVTGWIGDRYGPRAVTGLGAAAMAAGLATTGFVEHVGLAYLTYGLGVGLGAACAYVPTVAVLGGWFDRLRTRALSIAAAGTGCGMLILPPLAAALIQNIGWRGAMMVVGALSGISLAICSALVRVAPRPATSAPPSRLSTTLRSRGFVLIYASWMFGTMALLVPLVFLPAFAINQGIDPLSASWLISIIGGASVLGRVGVGSIKTAAGTIRLYKASILAMAGSYMIWLLLPGHAWLMTFAAVLGVAYGIRIALVAPVLIELFGVGRLGALLGSFFTATGIASLAGPLLASFAVDLTGSHTGGIVVALVFGTISFLVILPLRPR